MPIPSDYKELLSILNRHRVKYLIVGAYAVIHYTEPRYTKDLDIWVDPGKENAKKVYAALKEFGAPLKGITALDFTKKDLVYQVGVEPVRVDIIMGLPGLQFKKVWKQRTIAKLEGVRASVIGLNDLIKSKTRTKRPIDVIDTENLRLRSGLLGKKKQK